MFVIFYRRVTLGSVHSVLFLLFCYGELRTFAAASFLLVRRVIALFFHLCEFLLKIWI